MLAGAAAAGLLGPAATAAASADIAGQRYGLIGKFTATPGQRAALAAAILEAGAMPGCPKSAPRSPGPARSSPAVAPGSETRPLGGIGL